MNQNPPWKLIGYKLLSGDSQKPGFYFNFYSLLCCLYFCCYLYLIKVFIINRHRKNIFLIEYQRWGSAWRWFGIYILYDSYVFVHWLSLSKSNQNIRIIKLTLFFNSGTKDDSEIQIYECIDDRERVLALIDEMDGMEPDLTALKQKSQELIVNFKLTLKHQIHYEKVHLLASEYDENTPNELKISM